MSGESLPKIKIAGVPEHFNIPWHLAIKQGAFKAHGVEVFMFMLSCKKKN
jgi:hypothetical protein